MLIPDHEPKSAEQQWGERVPVNYRPSNVPEFISTKELEERGKRGAVLIYEDANWEIRHVKNVYAAKWFGRESGYTAPDGVVYGKWCIAVDSLRTCNFMLNSHTRHGRFPFFILKRKKRIEMYGIIFEDDEFADRINRQVPWEFICRRVSIDGIKELLRYHAEITKNNPPIA